MTPIQRTFALLLILGWIACGVAVAVMCLRAPRRDDDFEDD